MTKVRLVLARETKLAANLIKLGTREKEACYTNYFKLRSLPTTPAVSCTPGTQSHVRGVCNE